MKSDKKKSIRLKIKENFTIFLYCHFLLQFPLQFSGDFVCSEVEIMLVLQTTDYMLNPN